MKPVRLQLRNLTGLWCVAFRIVLRQRKEDDHQPRDGLFHALTSRKEFRYFRKAKTKARLTQMFSTIKLR